MTCPPYQQTWKGKRRRGRGWSRRHATCCLYISLKGINRQDTFYFILWGRGVSISDFLPQKKSRRLVGFNDRRVARGVIEAGSITTTGTSLFILERGAAVHKSRKQRKQGKRSSSSGGSSRANQVSRSKNLPPSGKAVTGGFRRGELLKLQSMHEIKR